MNDALVRRLRKLDCCAVSDSLDRLSVDGVVLGLHALTSQVKIAGRAITVALGADDGRKAHRHLGTAAVEAGGPGSIILIDHQGRTDVAGWGGILSLAAKTRGIDGILIDGACRDVDEAREMALPIYGRCGVPRTARGRIVELSWNEPIRLCGIVVVPGDYVLADGNGVVIVPQHSAESVIAVAEIIVRKERLMADEVRAGQPVSAVMGKSYENMLKESKP